MDKKGRMNAAFNYLRDHGFGKSADKGQSTADTDSGKANAAADAAAAKA